VSANWGVVVREQRGAGATWGPRDVVRVQRGVGTTWGPRNVGLAQHFGLLCARNVGLAQRGARATL